MNSDHLALQIRNKALELGFDQCGIIRAEAVAEYALRLEERMQTFPDLQPSYEPLLKLAFPQKTHEWAKSVIVCIKRYGKYQIPEKVDQHIGKYYLFDYRREKDSREQAAVAAFESGLAELGLKTAKDVLGITPARFVARKANLGVVRKNNLLYTQHGSWVWIETWLTDREMEFTDQNELPAACPDNCTRCIDACPTGALAGPFQMKINLCITRLTYQRNGLAPEPLRDKMGSWLYGCDACQNACPMNRNQWEANEVFPHLDAVVEQLALEKSAALDERTFEELIQPKFWYLPREGSWIWKSNALRAMANSYEPKYERYLKESCRDDHPYVREMAAWACQKAGL